MHYSSHPPCAFHNRIARYLGVLVAAALVAALGLPSAAQAQTPGAPMVEGAASGTDDATLTVSWGGALPAEVQTAWLLEYTEPGVAWAKATKVIDAPNILTFPGGVTANDPRIHHGIWKFRVSYYTSDSRPDGPKPQDTDKVIGTASAITDYQHGPPTAAPTGFAAYPAGPDARRLVWDAVKETFYDTRYTADATDKDAWTDWKPATSGETVAKLKMGAEYTFEVRGRGESRAGIGNLFGPSASTKEMVPVPTPTLPEIAALFLAMLLLGSGAYLLRRRQSGGLTPA